MPKSDTQFKPGQSGNPKGRPKNSARGLDGIPPEAKRKIYAVLLEALKLPNAEAASKYVENKAAALGPYGFLTQVIIRSMMGKNGWQTASDILDRLFGKPRQTVEARTDAAAYVIVPEKAVPALDKWKK